MAQTRTTNDAAGIAAMSILVQVLRELEDRDVLKRREIDNLLGRAYVGQADVADIPRTALNAMAQKLIAEVMAHFQNE